MATIFMSIFQMYDCSIKMVLTNNAMLKLKTFQMAFVYIISLYLIKSKI